MDVQRALQRARIWYLRYFYEEDERTWSRTGGLRFLIKHEDASTASSGDLGTLLALLDPGELALDVVQHGAGGLARGDVLDGRDDGFGQHGSGLGKDK